jgi:lysophospholipase L1-like esterase
MRLSWRDLGQRAAITTIACLALWMLPKTAAQAVRVLQAPPQEAGLDSPCKHLSPMPAEIQKQLEELVASRKAGKPLPPFSAADMAVYKKWQEQGLLEDFGGNCRYESANASLPPATDHRVVFMGDSITEGWGRMDPTLFSGDVINRGISGQTTAQMLVRFRQDVVDLHPHAVHILAGVNDLAGNTGPSSVTRVESNIMSMVDIATANHIEVVLASELPAAVIPWQPGLHVSAQLIALNVWMKDYAEKHGITYIDYYSKLVSVSGAFNPQLTIDGVHPNQAGYMVMEPMAEKALHIGK